LIELCQFHATNSFKRRDIFRIGSPLKESSDPLKERSGFAFPEYWRMPINSENDLVELNPQSDDYKMINRFMQDTIYEKGHGNRYGLVAGLNVDPKGFLITSIQRVQSPQLWKKYVHKRDEIMRDFETSEMQPLKQYMSNYKSLVPILDKTCNEFYFFHGTSRDIIEKILYNGFDSRFASREAMFGGGLYFAENSSKSNQYVSCPNCKNGAINRPRCNCQKEDVTSDYQLLFTRVCLGNPYICRVYEDKFFKQSSGEEIYDPIPKVGCSLDDHQNRHHSVLAESESDGAYTNLRLREFIVYDRSQTYPEYIINYKRMTSSCIQISIN